MQLTKNVASMLSLEEQQCFVIKNGTISFKSVLFDSHVLGKDNIPADNTGTACSPKINYKIKIKKITRIKTEESTFSWK